MNLEERFVRAITFCLKSDGQSGDLTDLARWALSKDDETPAPGNSSLKIALVSGGATRIKGYVFESARLPEIRGASGLLDRINLEDVRRLWSEPSPEGIGCEDCIIYANGGEVLAFAPLGKASWLADEIERLYARETMVAQSVAVWQAFELNQIRHGLLAAENIDDAAVKKLLGYNPADNKSFGSLVVPLALARFRRREANADANRKIRPIAHLETVPFARRCSSCERRAAVTNARVAVDDDRPLCEPCARKRIFGQLTKQEEAGRKWWERAGFTWQPETKDRKAKSWATRFEDWLDETPEMKAGYAIDEKGAPLADVRVLKAVNDLSELAQASTPQGFIGVVYADGNNMGQLLEHLKTPADYSTFADDVYRATQHAVFEALAKNLRPKSIQRQSAGQLLTHPFEILSIGGDDVFLVVPAQAAVKIACDITKFVERRLLAANSMFEPHEAHKAEIKYEWSQVQRCRGEQLNKQCLVSLSAGVVIADAHTPVFYLKELAEQLLKSAKRRAKWLKREHRYYGGTVDFFSLKSVTTISGTIEQFRAAALAGANRRIYARPYTVAEIETLLKTIELLKRAHFPRNQLYRLRESLHSGGERSIVDYHYFLSRDPAAQNARHKIERMWNPLEGRSMPHPWRAQLEQKEVRETIWFDLIELYDFVSIKDENHVQGQD